MNKVIKITAVVVFSLLFFALFRTKIEAGCYCSGSTQICYWGCEAYGSPSQNCLLYCDNLGYPYCDTFSSSSSACYCCDYYGSTSCAYGCSGGVCLSPTCTAGCGACSSGTYFSSAPSNSYVSGSRTCTRTDCSTYTQNCYQCYTGCQDGGTYYSSQPANVSAIRKYYYSNCNTVNSCYICSTGCHSGGTYYASTPSNVSATYPYTYSNCTTANKCYTCNIGCHSGGTYYASTPSNVSATYPYTYSNCTTANKCYTCSIGCNSGGTYYASTPSNVNATYPYTYSNCTTANKCYTCNIGCNSGGTYYASTPSVSTSITSIQPYTYSNCTTSNSCYTCDQGCGDCAPGGTYSDTQPANTYVLGQCTYTNPNCTTENKKQCYYPCPDATCADLDSEVAWQDTMPSGSYETYVGDVPIPTPTGTLAPLIGTTYSCPTVENNMTCYYPNHRPEVISLEAQVVNPSNPESVMQFTSPDYTGIDLNNPVRVVGIYEDADTRAEEIEAVYLWWSTSTTKDFDTPNRIDTLTGTTANNANFGIMLRRNSIGDWDAYVPHIDATNKTWERVAQNLNASGGTVSINLSGVPLASVHNITVSEDVGTVSRVTANVLMDITESVDTNEYLLWGSVSDIVGFLPFEGYSSVVVPNSNIIGHILPSGQTWEDESPWNLDMIKPVIPADTGISITSTADNLIQITVQGNDASDRMGLIYSRLDACRENWTDINPLITTEDNEPYTMQQGCSGFDSVPSFSHTDVVNSLLRSSAKIIDQADDSNFNISKVVDINGNVGGSITFYLTAMDYAGNHVYDTQIFRLGDWAVVEDGLVYGGQGVSSSTRPQDDDSVWDGSPLALTGGYLTMTPTTSDLTNQTLLSKNPTSLLRELINKGNGSFKATNFPGFSTDDIYFDLMEIHDSKRTLLGDAITVVSLTDPSPTISGSMSTICNSADEYCVIDSEDDLIIDSGFVCDKKGLINSRGSITIRPSFKNSDPADACIILANEDIIIEPGTLGDGTVNLERYDIVEAFLIAGSKITIPEDPNLDGLLVEGGLTAFNLSQGIENNRKIHFSKKNNFPLIVVSGNPKYGLLSRILFGSQIDVYQSEVGFKPY